MDCEDKVETFTSQDYHEIEKKEKKQTEQNKITMSKIFTKKKERERMLANTLEQTVFH